MGRFRRLVPVLFLFVCLAFAPAVMADDVVITSGRLTVASNGSLRFDLRGSEFRITGSSSASEGGIGPYRCFPCLEGSLSSVLAGFGTAGSRVTYQGREYVVGEYPDYDVTARLDFNAGDFAVPDELRNAAALRITSLFDFGGRSDALFAPQPFEVDLYGSGVARLLLVEDMPGSGDFNFGGIEYEFLAPGAPRPQPGVAAVPEPATMILLGTGLAGIGAAARRRRQQQAE